MSLKLSGVIAVSITLSGCIANQTVPRGDWIEKRVAGGNLTYIHATQSPKRNSVYLDALNHCTVQDKRLTELSKLQDESGNYVSKFVCN